MRFVCLPACIMCACGRMHNVRHALCVCACFICVRMHYVRVCAHKLYMGVRACIMCSHALSASMHYVCAHALCARVRAYTMCLCTHAFCACARMRYVRERVNYMSTCIMFAHALCVRVRSCIMCVCAHALFVRMHYVCAHA